MSVPADQPAVRLPLVKAAVGMLGAVAVSTALAAGIATMAEPGSVEAAVIAGAVAVVAIGFGLVPLAAAGPRSPLAAPMMWIACSMLRNIFGIAAGVFVYLLIEPVMVAFFGSLLFGLVSALIADVLIVIPRVRTAGADDVSERNA